MSVAQIRNDLLAWYDAHRRDLPWRAAAGERPDPYRVWLSEVMLQQTTTAHAAPYFERFTRRWPTVEALSQARPADVMAAWAGLGYYARARNLLECAKTVASAGGVFPSSEAALRSLPGIGSYTAAAIGAIAYGEASNAVDANVQRVIARLFAVEAELPEAAGELKRLAQRLVRIERAGDWAQALMDLGATVCRPRDVQCQRCPIGSHCLARKAGEPLFYPRRRPRPERPRKHGVGYLMFHAGQIAMVQRPSTGLLGGMVGLPTSDWRAEPWGEDESLAAAPVKLAWRAAGSIRHVFTHFSLSLRVFAGLAPVADPSFLWMERAAAQAGAPTLFRRAIELGL
jgi:A/G-specific adenine glycosylase